MNEDRLKGNWEEMRGKVQRKWGELTDDELDQVKGSRKELVGILQKRYGKAKDEIEREVKSLEES
ncbi:CsbD family protein [Aquisalimonas sp.]|uniref:CsbD family protein n=1 Tax=Aquisalimonas sp. TaxID=1872621 RepID=UPI0025B8EC8B|nr:CsbD family protein [Aquisalimonas sp.]